MATHSGKVCVKTILKLDVKIAGIQACRIEASQRAGPEHRTEIVNACNSVIRRSLLKVSADMIKINHCCVFTIQ